MKTTWLTASWLLMFAFVCSDNNHAIGAEQGKVDTVRVIVKKNAFACDDDTVVWTIAKAKDDRAALSLFKWC